MRSPLKDHQAYQRSQSNTPKPPSNSDSSWGNGRHEAESRSSRFARTSKDNPTIRSYKDLLFEAATTSNGSAAEISIRGAAGPYVVIGSNFAPGTSAADIEHALLSVGGEMQSCRILKASPTVVAEMVFAEKTNAQSIIDTFNGKKVWRCGTLNRPRLTDSNFRRMAERYTFTCRRDRL